MSVLFKALQKAAKDNERHQGSQLAFDAGQVTGASRPLARRLVTWRIAGAVITVVFLVAMGTAFYLTSSPSSPPPQLQTVAPGGSPAVSQASTQPSAAAALTPPAATAAPAQPAAVAAGTVAKAEPAGAAGPENTVLAAAAPSAPEVAAEPPSHGATAPVSAKISGPAKPAVAPPMPKIDVDSPARMLSPPIDMRRPQFELSGVGSAVQVRQVSQAAQDTVGSAYNALIRGEYDTALGFYDKTLKEEPTSVLALLGRGAALQKLGRTDDARSSYESALKIDPDNREALTNLISIEGERAPGEALKRLMDLERDYPKFSPIKAAIAMIYAKMDKLDGAVEYFRRALVLTPEALMYKYNYALVLDRMGQREQAVAVYTDVLQSVGGRQTPPEFSVADVQRRVDFLRAR